MFLSCQSACSEGCVYVEGLDVACVEGKTVLELAGSNLRTFSELGRSIISVYPQSFWKRVVGEFWCVHDIVIEKQSSIYIALCVVAVLSGHDLCPVDVVVQFVVDSPSDEGTFPSDEGTFSAGMWAVMPFTCVLTVF